MLRNKIRNVRNEIASEKAWNCIHFYTKIEQPHIELFKFSSMRLSFDVMHILLANNWA